MPSPTPPPGISSFIPGTTLQIAWDATSLTLLKTCGRKYQYTIVEGWRSKHESPHLVFGGVYHSALETYDRERAAGVAHWPAMRTSVRHALEATWERGTFPVTPIDADPSKHYDMSSADAEGRPWDSGHNLKTRNTLIRTIIWYLDQFGEDPARTVILANGKPAVELSFRFETDYYPAVTAGGAMRLEGDEEHAEFNTPYILSGHLDRVVNFLGSTYILDRKTTGSTISPKFFQDFDPDTQMTLYTLASKVVYSTPVTGVMIDGAQIAVGFTRFERGFTHRSQGQLDEFYRGLRTWFDLAEKYSAEDHWPLNEASCGNYGGCVFRKICSKDPGVRRNFLEADFTKRFWNPLDAR